MDDSFLYIGISDHSNVILESGEPFRSFPVYSITKSITSLLVGIWLEQNPQFSASAPVFPALLKYSPRDPRWRDMTIQHILTQCSGLKWREIGVPWGPSNPLWLMENQAADWLEYLLNTPFSASPGKHFVYNSGASYLLTYWMQYYTPRDLLEFARDHFFDPLEIPVIQGPGDGLSWKKSPQGIIAGGKGIFCSGRCLLRIARMVADCGYFRGRRIVPEKWIEESLRVQHRGHHAFGQYGYQWWIQEDGIVAAMGFGGQLLLAHRESGLAGVFLRDDQQGTDFSIGLSIFRKKIAERT